MNKIKLNENFGRVVVPHDYVLDPKKEYVINFNDEFDQQQGILNAVMTMGLPAIDDYHKWLADNGFNQNEPNPTNSFVSKYYGKGPLWNTDQSQGIVVKSEDDDDYYIVMECSRLNEGFKYTQIILTFGGCL